MHSRKPNGDTFHDISVIDARLAELEKEKQNLITLKEELQTSQLTSTVAGSFSAEQKISQRGHPLILTPSLFCISAAVSL